MSDEQQLGVDFGTELGLLQQEIEEIDELYSEVKNHLENVRTGRKGSLAFVHQQTANLISLREKKLQLIKALVSTKSSSFSNYMKELQHRERVDGGDDSLPHQLVNVLSQALQLTAEQLTGVGPSTIIVEAEEACEDDLEAAVAALPPPEEGELCVEVITGEADGDGEVEAVVDVDGNWYVIENGIVSDEYELPDCEVEFDMDDDGELIAKDPDGDPVRIVDKSELRFPGEVEEEDVDQAPEDETA